MQIINSNFKQPRLRVLAPRRELSFQLISPLLEGRRNAERRTLVTAAAYFPDCRETEAHGNASQRPVAATSSTLGPVLPGAGASKLAIQAGFRPPFACPVQPLKAAPRIGHGRLPKAPRVCVCETQPRAPHQPSGYPSGQLSLCPASVTPLEAPLIGQDGRTIKPPASAGIGIHSQVRERQFVQTFVPRTQRSVWLLRNGALQSHKRVYARLRRAMAPVTCESKKPGSRFCEAALRKSYAPHRARDTRLIQ
jgi:hypothetical protein